MTVTHVFFALVTTAYILVAIQFEERDLMAAHPEYAEYRQRVPMIVPGMPRRVEMQAIACQWLFGQSGFLQWYEQIHKHKAPFAGHRRNGVHVPLQVIVAR